MSQKKSIHKIIKVSLSLPEDVVDFLDALAGLGGYQGKNHTEVATSIVKNKVNELADAGVIEKRKKTIQDVREFLGKNKNNKRK